MATVELRPDEEYDFDGVRIFGALEEDEELHTYAALDGWKKREFDLEIDASGGHVDWLAYTREAPDSENARVLGAIATFARRKSPEIIEGGIITVEDYQGNLL